jgi:hypothetical protein
MLLKCFQCSLPFKTFHFLTLICCKLCLSQSNQVHDPGRVQESWICKLYIQKICHLTENESGLSLSKPKSNSRILEPMLILARDGGCGTCTISWCACNGGGFVKVSLVFVCSEDVVLYPSPYFFRPKKVRQNPARIDISFCFAFFSALDFGLLEGGSL